MPRAAKKTAKRIDPPARPIDGALPYFNVQNKDPGREYVWVYKAAQDFGVEHYLYMGWEMERYREGGPLPSIRPVKIDDNGQEEDLNGRVIESRGNVLMSMDKAKHAQMVEYGADGVSGQHAADERDSRLLDKTKHMKDAMRGINPRLKNGDKGFGIEATDGAIAAIPVGEDDDG